MIKSIETVWDGIKFRSRTEARWAAFFSAIGIEFQYEMEGFHLSSGEMYVPDFWIPECKCWIEIKGVKDGHQKHINDLMEVCEKTDKDSFGFVFVGQPFEMQGSFVGCDSTDNGGGTYQNLFDAGIAFGSTKETSPVFCVNSGFYRDYLSATYEPLENVWNDDFRNYWKHDFGRGSVYACALGVSKIRFWK